MSITGIVQDQADTLANILFLMHSVFLDAACGRDRPDWTDLILFFMLRTKVDKK